MPEEKYKEAVKYYRGIKKYGDAQKLLKDKIDEEIKSKFKMEEGYDIRGCVINAGKAFEVEVDIYIWIIQRIK
ncbi:hypothetical protein [Clostridium aciditolerans]|uniref:Uncharacterized protein n=1 Tax=Clostridium aciditolerans TaxID=339861 RepID=A0A934HY72_9CLOT|nr:hypothetical protein [Clostridium aciditolerans]MBI6873429.1 hypothetical protein [Clostridium aciditolerans]